MLQAYFILHIHTVDKSISEMFQFLFIIWYNHLLGYFHDDQIIWWSIKQKQNINLIFLGSKMTFTFFALSGDGLEDWGCNRCCQLCSCNKAFMLVFCGNGEVSLKLWEQNEMKSVDLENIRSESEIWKAFGYSCCWDF